MSTVIWCAITFYIGIILGSITMTIFSSHDKAKRYFRELVLRDRDFYEELLRLAELERDKIEKSEKENLQ